MKMPGKGEDAFKRGNMALEIGKSHWKACAVGAAAYPLIELLWRGKTDASMSAAGGISMLALFEIERSMKKKSLLARCLCGAGAITTVELCAGVLVNGVMKKKVWDYSKNKFNFAGQICLPYTLLWALLCIPAFAVCKKIK